MDLGLSCTVIHLLPKNKRKQPASSPTHTCRPLQYKRTINPMVSISNPKQKRSMASSTLRLFSPPAHHPRLRPMTASVSENPTVPASSHRTEPVQLPIRKIPGDYGLPLIGPIMDRQDYFYNQGRDEFFKSRIHKHRSTVFRTNLPPGPTIANDPRVVVLLDGKSFPVLFDVTKVDKKDLFTGTFMPSTDLTGGYRMLSYMDPTEPNHGKLKRLMFYLLKERRDHVIPEFESTYRFLFEGLESEVATKGKASFTKPSEQAAFTFLAKAFFGTDPAVTRLGSDGPSLVSKWVLFQLGPLLSLGLPKLLEEFTLHSFRLPFFLIKKDYNRLYEFFLSSSSFVLEEADRVGISREEACHNLVFSTCFNSFGGMKIFFPNLVKWLGRGGVKLHTELAREVRSAIRITGGGRVTMAAIESMPLVKSTVYEALRVEPPVPLQFGRAKRDMIVESHDAAFEVKRGELLFGYQPFATRDPKIFDRAEEFVADRFVGEEGEQLLRHVLWSNGPETEAPSVGNKQCAGKDFVVLVSRLMVVELFRRYDSFDVEVSKSPLGANVTITSLKRASF